MNTKYHKTELTKEDLYAFINRLNAQPILDRYYAEHNAPIMQKIEKEQLKQMETQIYKEIEKMLDGFNKR